MSDTSLLFSILARSNLKRTLDDDASAVDRLRGALVAVAASATAGASSLGSTSVSLGLVAVGAAGAAHSAVALGSALAPALGILAAVPAAGLLAYGVMSTLRVAVSGVGDAFSAALGDDAKAFEESLTRLSPAAQSAARELREVKPVVDALRLSVQNALFAQLHGDLTATSAVLLGPLAVGMTGVSTELGVIGHRVAGVAQQSETVNLLNGVFWTLRSEIAAASVATGPLLVGIRDFVYGTLPAFTGAGNAVGSLAARFGMFLSSAAASGQALGWIWSARTVFEQLAVIVGNVFGIITAIFSATPPGTGLLVVLGDLTGMVRAFLESVEGQTTLAAIFSTITTLAQIAIPVVGAVLGLLAPILPFVALIAAQISGVLVPALLPVLVGLSPIVGRLVVALTPLVGVALMLLAALLPIVPPVAELAVQIIEGLVPAVIPLISLLTQLATVVLLGLVVPALQGVVPPLVTIVGWVSTVAQVILTALLGAVLWLVQAVPAAWRAVSDGAGSMVNTVIGWWNGLLAFFVGIPGWISNLGASMWNGFWEGFRAVINWIISGWNRIEFTVPPVEIPYVGTFGGFTIGLPDIPMLALGGNITAGGLAVVGERGPELLNLPRGAQVTPLSRGGGGGGGTTVIHVHGALDPIAVAREIERMLRKYSRETGRVELAF